MMIKPAKKWSLHKRRHSAPLADGSSLMSGTASSDSVLVTSHQSFSAPISSQLADLVGKS